MKLTTQKRLAAHILKCGEKRVWFNPVNLNEIKEAITRSDIRGLINKGIIIEVKPQSQSKGRARLNRVQKRKGRRQGPGSREGSVGARITKKQRWIIKVRAQRDLLSTLRSKSVISTKSYRNLYNKVKSGIFRSRRHIKLYIEENKLAQNENKK
ncbi:MAG TPA: 50S ribosomal protein L19e [Candidatus Nanoarchaeia archaeon]|nr:50S ribosomal protein L19e [Candidatus Nanoarchaeia archaeon]